MSESAFIYLVRHGEAAMPDEHGRWGLRSAGLTRRGIIQVERLARALAATDVDCIYSSDVPRAKETAAILGRKLKATPIELKNLHEIDIGKFEGMTLDVLRSSHREFLPWIECSFFGRFPSATFHHPASLRFPGGEDVYEMYSRAVPRFIELAGRSAGLTSIFVGHAWLIQSLICHVTGAPPDQYFRFAGRNASMNLVEVGADGRGVLHLLNAGELLTEVAAGRLRRAGRGSDDRPSDGFQPSAAEPSGQ